MRVRPASTASPSSSSTARHLVATTTTAGDGNYTFNNLAAGTYTVKVVPGTLPAGVTPTFDLDGVATANQATLTLAAGSLRTDVDFGYRGTASVGDRVWLDTNGNGTQDAGETGINGVTVQLLDSSSTVIATTTTSGDGNYTFSNLLGGSYTVRVVSGTLPAGFTPTFDLDGIATANTGQLHPRRRQPPHRRRLRLPRHGFGRRPRLVRRQRQRRPGLR